MHGGTGEGWERSNKINGGGGGGAAGRIRISYSRTVVAQGTISPANGSIGFTAGEPPLVTSSQGQPGVEDPAELEGCRASSKRPAPATLILIVLILAAVLAGAGFRFRSKR